MAKKTKNDKTVDGYIAGLSGDLADTVTAARALILAAAPKATECIKWSQPVFEHHGPFAYIKAYKAHVNFGFWRGADLDDPKGVLEGTGDKMRHTRLTKPGDLKKTALRALVKQAVRLNREQGDPTKG